jgi:hypothetical protein
MPSDLTSLASKYAGVFNSQARACEQLTIISGPSGAGKTTWCQNAAIQAHAAVLPVAGLISPAIFERGEKVGIAVVDLKSGERRVLATRRPPEREGGCVWRFHPDAILWANHCLQAVRARDILFVDELGPLELLHGQGFQQGLILIDAGFYSQAFVVVRPSLLPVARSRWPGAHLLRMGNRLP